jgi:hypothetical protein
MLSEEMPVWAKLYTLVSMRYGEVLEEGSNGSSSIEYPISEIPLVRKELGDETDPLFASESQIEMRDLTKLTSQELSRYLITESGYNLDYLVGQPIPFNLIKPEYRPQIFAHYLRDAVERSIDVGMKALADERNRMNSSREIVIEPRTLLHSSDIRALPHILALGSLCGEALELNHKVDATPLQVDLALFAGEKRESGQSAIDLISTTAQNGYGNFTILFKPTEGSKDSDVLHNFGPWSSEGQVLRPGGIASSEIVGIYFKDGVDRSELGNGVPVGLQTIKRQIVRNGFYIPMYDKSGELIFTVEEFDELKTRLTDTNGRQQKISELQASDSVNPREFIDLLSDNPDLEQQFSASSGVSEGYTLREHTEAVVGQFEKHFAASYKSPILSRGAFRTMLALHDIGKAQGVVETGSTTAQHQYTVSIVSEESADLGISERESEIMVEVLSHDYLGEFIKGQSDTGMVADSIYSMAERLDVEPDDLLELMETYYMCDASSYTGDAQYSSNSGSDLIFTIDSIGYVFDFSLGGLRLSQQNREKIQELQNALTNYENTEREPKPLEPTPATADDSYLNVSL